MLKTNVFIVNTIKTNIRCLSFEIFDLNDSKTCVFVYIFSHMYKFHCNSVSPYHYRYTDKNPSRLYPTFQKAIPHFVLFKISLYYPRNNISPSLSDLQMFAHWWNFVHSKEQAGRIFVESCSCNVCGLLYSYFRIERIFFYLKYKLRSNKLIYNKQGLSCSVKLLVTTTSSIA